MKYPCENCLVDPICVITCLEFRIYLKNITEYDKKYTNSPSRFRRLFCLTYEGPEYFENYLELYRKHLKKLIGNKTIITATQNPRLKKILYI